MYKSFEDQKFLTKLFFDLQSFIHIMNVKNEKLLTYKHNKCTLVRDRLHAIYMIKIN